MDWATNYYNIMITAVTPFTLKNTLSVLVFNVRLNRKQWTSTAFKSYLDSLFAKILHKKTLILSSVKLPMTADVLNVSFIGLFIVISGHLNEIYCNSKKIWTIVMIVNAKNIP